MHCKSKFAKQSSTTPDSINLRISTSQCLPDNRASALRGPDSFFSSEERVGEERRRQRRGGGPPALGSHPLGTASGLQPHTVRGTRQICACIRALAAGVQTACRFAVAYEDTGVAWGPPWSAACGVERSHAARRHSQRCTNSWLPFQGSLWLVRRTRCSAVLRCFAFYDEILRFL